MKPTEMKENNSSKQTEGKWAKSGVMKHLAGWKALGRNEEKIEVICRSNQMQQRQGWVEKELASKRESKRMTDVELKTRNCR